jgi:hypothetical protein
MSKVRLTLYDDAGYMQRAYLEIDADLLMLSVQRINQQGARVVHTDPAWQEPKPCTCGARKTRETCVCAHRTNHA